MTIEKPFYIIVTYGRGRNIHHGQFWFDSYEEAKSYGKAVLDPDENVSRYTIYKA